MKKGIKKSSREIIFTSNNDSNMRTIIDNYKHILVCGIRGVGKITHTVAAVKDNNNIYYIGNPVDHEGKLRPGSLEKYLEYILSLKEDMRIVDDIADLFQIKRNIIVIIDEIYGRSERDLVKLGKLFDMENVQAIQIVGCMKYMGSLIKKMDIIVVLEHHGAFTIDKEFGESICNILGKKST